MRCPKCGEPWDLDSLHDELTARLQDGRVRGVKVVGTYPKSGNPRYDPADYERAFNKMYAMFRKDGCVVLGASCTTHGDREVAAAARAIYGILDNDVDGAEAELEDMGL